MKRAIASLTLAATLCVAPYATAPAFAQTRLPPEGFADLAEKLMPSVVNIATRQQIRGVGEPANGRFRDLFGENALNASSLGSGFVVRSDGVILTNNHVVAEADEIEVVLQTGERLKAEVLGRDPATDLAVLKVVPPRPLPAARFGDARALRVGDLVIAIGNPFGLGAAVSAGIVSARNRNISQGRYDDFIQTDAAINKGNSGGPLFNMAGEVVGVNTAIVSPSGSSVGVGFATPADLVQSVLKQILQYGETRRGWLGVRIGLVTPDAAQRAGLPGPKGALVTAVTPDGPAARGGLQAGDIILAFDGREIVESRALTRYVADTPIDKSAPVEVARGGKRLTLNVTVARLIEGRHYSGAGPRGPAGGVLQPEQRRLLGVTLATLSEEMRSRFSLGRDVKGLVVVDVDERSDAAGKLRPGDVVTEIQFEEVETIAQAQRVIERVPRERPVLVYLSRGGDMTFRSITTR